MLNRSLLTCLTLGAVALGGMSSASADVVSFRDGVNGYAGTADTYVAASAPSTNFGTNFALQISGSGGTGANAGIQQSLVRFDDIFGSGPEPDHPRLDHQQRHLQRRQERRVRQRAALPAHHRLHREHLHL